MWPQICSLRKESPRMGRGVVGPWVLLWGNRYLAGILGRTTCDAAKESPAMSLVLWMEE